jgi:hypothetical protein
MCSHLSFQNFCCPICVRLSFSNVCTSFSSPYLLSNQMYWIPILYIAYLRLITKPLHFRFPVNQSYPHMQSSHSINIILYYQNLAELRNIFCAILTFPIFHFATVFAVALALHRTFLQSLTHQWYPISPNPAYLNPFLTCISYRIYFLILWHSYREPSLNIYYLLFKLVCISLSYLLLSLHSFKLPIFTPKISNFFYYRSYWHFMY